MPKRFITIPEPIQFKDPRSGEEVEGPDGYFDFETLLHKVSDNPKWNTTYKLGRAMDSVWAAWEGITSNRPGKGGSVLVLAEEDWEALKESVENPKQQIITQLGPQVVPGFGFQPRLVRQILPLCRAVIEAPQTDPREAKEKAS